jgi:hypothetical protein
MSAGTTSNKALHVTTLSGWYRFERNGPEWKPAKRDLSYWALTCLSVDPETPERIYAGTEHSGLFYSEDAGSHWLRANPNVPKMMLFCVLALPGTVMVGTVPSALYKKQNGAWEELTGVRAHSGNATFPPSPELQSRTRYITPDPADPNRLYAGIEVGGMLVSDDAGANWTPANNGLTDMDVHEILASRQTPGLVLAACGEKVFRSTNRAQQWEEITPRTHDYGMSVAEDGKGVIYLGSARGRPNTWIREAGAEGRFFAARTADRAGNRSSTIYRRRHAHVRRTGSEERHRSDIGWNAARSRRFRRADCCHRIAMHHRCGTRRVRF